MTGNRKWKVPVNGDLAKVKHVEEIKNDRIATRMLSSLRASFERIEGSQEIRFPWAGGGGTLVSRTFKMQPVFLAQPSH